MVRTVLTSACLLVGTAAVPTPAADAAHDSRSADIPAWTRIPGTADTGCAFGTPFSFFFRKGSDESKLVVYFEGGGACWEWVSCSGMFDTSVADDELAPFAGIFDFSHPENPFATYSILFVPYCTGDVHVGDTVQHYGNPARPVAHFGYRNVQAALRWLSATLRQPPTSLVVTGTSAGSYGALFYAPLIADHFASASVTLIGDSGLPLLNDYVPVLRRWGAADVVRRIRRMDHPATDADLSLERAHAYFASRQRMAVLAQITSDRDAVQTAFYVVSGSPHARRASYAIVDALEASNPRFHSFIVAGGDHGLLVTNKLYAYAVDEVRLVEWLRALTAGERVGSHWCAACKSR